MKTAIAIIMKRMMKITASSPALILTKTAKLFTWSPTDEEYEAVSALYDDMCEDEEE